MLGVVELRFLGIRVARRRTKKKPISRSGGA
jgi:hypothetical protein